MRRQVGVEAQVGAPCLVHDERDVGRVRRTRQARDVGARADVAGLHDEDGAGLRMVGEHRSEPLHGQAPGKSGHLVDLGLDPHRGEAGEHEAQQQ